LGFEELVGLIPNVGHGVAMPLPHIPITPRNPKEL
jgi:hypothetical protein